MTQVAKGRGTYTVGALLILYGLVGGAIGVLSPDEAGKSVLEGLGLVFLRRAIGGPPPPRPQE